uniref:(California timema) hypothetical protein n=1 Tax=Timema californicum TaxID=61474 RepID=A0A7R9JCQ8_TIMCA|nr:unnamed protein product [Timema californicum]
MVQLTLLVAIPVRREQDLKDARQSVGARVVPDVDDVVFTEDRFSYGSTEVLFSRRYYTDNKQLRPNVGLRDSDCSSCGVHAWRINSKLTGFVSRVVYRATLEDDIYSYFPGTLHNVGIDVERQVSEFVSSCACKAGNMCTRRRQSSPRAKGMDPITSFWERLNSISSTAFTGTVLTQTLLKIEEEEWRKEARDKRECILL